MKSYCCMVEILSTEFLGVLCVFVPGCEVINSEGRTTSVVCSEVIVFPTLLLNITHAFVGCDVGFLMVPGLVGGLPCFRL
jgi:hypothetical protein